MRLDRNDPERGGVGKYALINIRKTLETLSEVSNHPIAHLEAIFSQDLCRFGLVVEYQTTPATDFFVLRLKDVHAAPALRAYAESVEAYDPEFAAEVRELAFKAEHHPLRRQPD